MRLGRFKITHSGFPPYSPNWDIFKWGITLAGWNFCWLSKEFIKEEEFMKQLWEKIQ